MFGIFKRKSKPSKHRECSCERQAPPWLDLFDTQPRDSEGSLIALDDLVSHGRDVLQVVAMSHKGKVVVRKRGTDRGGRWVKASECTIVKRHDRKGD